MAQLLAPNAERITCLDRSETVLGAARRRLETLPNVGFRLGDMHDLPFDDGSFDQALLLNTLTYAHAPLRVLCEAARVLRPGGRLVSMTLNAHRYLDVTTGYGHTNSGFRPAELSDMLRAAGLTVRQCGVTFRERRKPYFEVIAASAQKPTRPDQPPS
jgi:ubiquinone/menaquinone biosynthesis C-methylase UbiE